MKNTQFKNGNFFLISILSFIVVVLILLLFNYTNGEGFNPSDDGVILSQSFRLLSGQVPHVDFISIRPVLSGYIHSIHFFSPLSLETSARWFVVFEYWVYSFLWVILLFSYFPLQFSKRIYVTFLFVVTGVFAFLLNANHYNLFPWTTIDALMLSVSGIFFYQEGVKNEGVRNIFMLSAGLILMSLSALCRQSFVIIPAAFFIFTFFKYYKRRFLSVIIIGFFTVLPFIVYLIPILSHKGFGSFIRQMTGRTELIETGIITFGKMFIRSKLLVIHIVIFLGGFLHWLKHKAESRKYLFIKYKEVIPIVILFYILSNLFFSFYLFFNDTWGLFDCAFNLFWVLFVTSISIVFIIDLQLTQKLLIWASILISWTSSISLGDNSPVFTVGLMASTTLLLCFYLLEKISIINYVLNKTSIIIISFLFLAFSGIAVWSQKKYNYRDLSSGKLEYKPGKFVPAFGQIMTNRNTFEYLEELTEIVELYNLRNHVAIVPNFPGFYAFFDTKNPLPVDWMQPAEYIGSENELRQKMNEIIQKGDVWFIAEKLNSKNLSHELVAVDEKPYFYFNDIEKNYEEVQANYKFFRVFKPQ